MCDICSPHDASPTLDYAYLTHFHDDHMGGPTASAKTARGGYKLSGITEVIDLVPPSSCLTADGRTIIIRPRSRIHG